MIRGAIIGLGKIATTAHLPAYDKMKDRIEIVAGVDTQEESRNSFKEKYPDVRLYPGIEELFSNEKIDFIDLCTTPRTHYELLKKITERNINIICEKPFTASAEESLKIYDIIKKSNLAFIPCHQYRYSPIWSEFKKMADRGNGDDKFFAQFDVLRTKADEGFDVNNPGWRTNPKLSGGGIIADTGVHYIYLIHWIFGKPIRITANTYNVSHNYPVEDTAMFVIETAKGVAQVNLSWGGDKRYNAAKIISKNGGLYYDGIKMIRSMNGTEENIPVPDASDKSHYINYYVNLFDDFIREVGNKTTKQFWLDEASASVQILKKCYESAKEKKTIEY
jgi:predicted dehydrogenase